MKHQEAPTKGQSGVSYERAGKYGSVNSHSGSGRKDEFKLFKENLDYEGSSYLVYPDEPNYRGAGGSIGDFSIAPSTIFSRESDRQYAGRD